MDGRTRTFLIWYAKEKGWDKEAGLDIDIQYFGSGMDILNALPSGSWVFAGMGGVPAMMGNLRYGTSVIAIGNDESMTNSVLVRPDSPIAKVKGYNKDFPEVLGSPDTVKGKTFLYTQSSSQHFGMSEYLKALGLTEKDVVMQNMDRRRCWLPLTRASATSRASGPCGSTSAWNGATSSSISGDVNAVLTLTLVGAQGPSGHRPPRHRWSKFLRGLAARREHDQEGNQESQARRAVSPLLTEWAGQDIEPQMAKMDLEYHPVFDIDQQLAIFDDSKGPSQVEQWQDKVLDFFARRGASLPRK